VNKKIAVRILNLFVSFLLIGQSVAPALSLIASAIPTVYAQESPSESPDVTTDSMPSPEPLPPLIVTNEPSPTSSSNEIQNSPSQSEIDQNSSDEQNDPSPLPESADLEVEGNQEVNVDVVPSTNFNQTFLDFRTIESEGSATLSTDQSDYAPESTVRVSGSGYLPNQTLTIKITWPDGTVRGSGNRVGETDSTISNDKGELYFEYLLTDGQEGLYKVEILDSSGKVSATTAFTDSRTTVSATLNGASSVTVVPSASITAAVAGTLTSGDDWHSTGWRIATSSGSYTCVNTTDHDSNGTFTESLAITAPSTPGTYNAYFRISGSNSNCDNETGSIFTMTNAVTVISPDLTATKTNNVGGNATVNQAFTWTIRIQNSGAATVTFTNNQEVLRDERPSSGVSSYGSPTVTSSGTTGNLSCTETGSSNRDLTCKANGTVTMPAGSYSDISYTVTPSSVGSLSNPRSGAVCRTDRNTVISESNEGNNDCSNSVTVNPPDTTPPTDPTDVHSTNHTVNTPSQDNTIDMAWTVAGSAPGATDAGSGVDGYSYQFSNSPTTVPDTTKDAEESAITTTSSVLADGTWYFHLRTRDNAGNWTSTVHKGPFIIDQTAPQTTIDSGPTGFVSSTNATFEFSASESATFECQLDGSGFSACTSPKAYSDLVEGAHTFNVQATDDAGNTDSTPASRSWTVDTTAPSDPTDVASSDHAVDTPSNDSTITMTWAMATDNESGSGVDGYAFVFNDSADSVCDNSKDLEETETTVTSEALVDGAWWFHICTVDNVGNWTTTVNVGPFIIDTQAPTSTITSPDEDSFWNSPIEILGSSTDFPATTVDYVKLFASTSGDEDWFKIAQLNNDSLSEPFAWTFNWVPDENGTYDITAEATDTAGNTESSPVVENITYDITPPTTPVADPANGDYPSDQSVTLLSSDNLSGVDKIYYTTDGTDPSAENGTLYDATITVDKDMTIKAIAYDKAGNTSDILTAVYGIPPIISAETSSSVTSSSVTITWTTDDPATSRVVYDTVSHPVLGAAPNYGYTNSTVETDTGPKVTSHSVTINGLTSGTTYFFRTVSHGSPEAVSSESSFSTSSNTSSSNSPTSSTSSISSASPPPSTSNVSPAVAGIQTSAVSPAQNTQGEVLSELSEAAGQNAQVNPTPETPATESGRNLTKSQSIIIILIVVSGLLLILFGLKRRKSEKTP